MRRWPAVKTETESMVAQHYYLLSALPSLGELGSDPPIGRQRLLAMVAESHGPREIVEALLTGDDLLQREAILAGEMDGAAEPAVLSPAQMRDEEPLPAFPVPQRERPPVVAADAVWAGYFHYVAQVARLTHSEFLLAWVGFEVALRNALAAERAKALGLEPSDYLVAAELADPEADLTATVSEWSAATDPLSALRSLDRGRWSWLVRHDKWFSFGDDELAAYAAKLSLLHRWLRLREQARE